MTVIYYDGKDLYGDHRIATMGRPTQIRDTGKKLFVSQDGQFAYGLAGTLPSGAKRLLIEADFRTIMTKFVSEECTGPMECEKEFPDLFERLRSVTAVVLTKTMGYSFEHGHILPADQGCVTGFGTGMCLMTGLNYVIKDMKKCFELLSQEDPLVSPTFDTIRIESLKPFIVE